MKWLNELNAQQQKAVQAAAGPLLIIAGPGTGKTKTLTARIAYLLASGQAAAPEITALTFTNKAAQEMQTRLASLLGTTKSLPRIATFHAFGYETLSNTAGAELQFVNETERLQLIRSLPKRSELKGVSSRELAARISRYKTALSTSQNDPMSQLVKHYNTALTKRGLHDFDDLLQNTYQLLTSDTALQKRLAASCQFLLVDEFQDTNELQYELLKLLQTNQNIFAIGDPHQSIYAFRGASGTIFERFKTDFPKVKTINLTVNYRSAPEIIRLSNTIFPNTTPLQAHQTITGQVQAVQVLNEYSEADWIIQQIEHHLGGTDMLKGHQADISRQKVRQFSDYAVLYRTHQTAKMLEQKLADCGLPYQVVGDGSPYEQPLIQTLLQGLRFLAGGQPPEMKEFSESQVKTLLKDIDTGQPLSHLTHRLTKTLGLIPSDDRERRSLSQFISTLVRFDDQPLTVYLQHLDHIAEQAFYDPNAQAITLLTIHAAKGLEFTHVFLLGAEEGLLPYQRKTKQTDIQEEQRLFYVAVTRAQTELDILYTKMRGGQSAKPSPFITKLPPQILPHIVDPEMSAQQKRLQKRRLKRAQQSLF